MNEPCFCFFRVFVTSGEGGVLRKVWVRGATRDRLQPGDCTRTSTMDFMSSLPVLKNRRCNYA